MLLAGMAVQFVGGGELHAADRAGDAAYCLLGDGPAGVFCRRVFALVVVIKFLAGGKDGSACLADKLVACHRLSTPFALLSPLC